MDKKNENSKPEYFTLSTIDNAVDSLETCLIFLLSETELKWKWIGASLLHSLYMFCIELLEHGNYENVLTNNENEDNERFVKIGNDTRWKKSTKVYRENSNGYIIKWDYIDGEPSFSRMSESGKMEKRLISFWTALARVQDEEVEGLNYSLTEPLRLSETQWNSLEWLYKIVNKIIMYVPKTWSIDGDLFKEYIKNTIPVIEFVASQSIRIRHISFGEESTQSKVKNIINEIKDKLDTSVIKIKEEILEDVKDRDTNENKNIIEVYAEGDNYIYLNKARQFFYPSMNVDFISYGGKSELRGFYNRMKKNRPKIKKIILYDCDAIKEFEGCEKDKSEKILPLLIEHNTENEKVKNGIENLFNVELFEEKFYMEEFKQTLDGGHIKKKILNKKEFRKNVCNKRNKKEDFINFEPILIKIQEIIDM